MSLRRRQLPLPGATMIESRRRENGLQRLLELGLYAPVGLISEFSRLLPELVESGRKRVEFNSSLGRATLRNIARAASDAPTGHAGARKEQTKASSRQSASDAHMRQRDGSPVIPLVDPQVAGYADMTAKEVIKVLSNCDEATLRWVSNSESTGKNRVTVMRALADRGIT